MKISFVHPFLSISSFPTITLPKFTLITGVNGAGKSHFLQALAEGHLSADCAPNPKLDSRLYDWTNMAPRDVEAISSEQLQLERVNLVRQLGQLGNRTAERRFAEQLGAFQIKYRLPDGTALDPWKLQGLTIEQLGSLLNDKIKAQEAIQEFENVLQQYNNHTIASLPLESQLQLRSLSSALRIPAIHLQEDDLRSPPMPTFGQAELFQQSFARLFLAYRDLLVRNSLIRLRAANETCDEAYLSDEDFYKKNNRPPWEFVNDSLASSGLDFRINSPDIYSLEKYSPSLTKISSGRKISFSSLSSGEKVIMSFAFCVYYARNQIELATKPKLLLFDEVDAPLHPSMSKSIINTIINTLVGNFGIAVVLTTHSPSTVALAPEEALYVMVPGEPGLQKTTKAAALNVLTTGVPTLSISYEGRRQVFVESPADAAVYGKLYELLKDCLSSERSLEFISTGSRSATGGTDQNTGCDNVLRIVKELSKTGNQSVFGLLDWDGHRESTPRIEILAADRRNGLENVLLDPLLLAAIVVRHNDIQFKKKISVPDTETFINFINSAPEKLQRVVEEVEHLVLGDSSGPRVESVYNGLKLSVSKRYITTDDHELETKVKVAFPFLKQFTEAGKLMQKIVTDVLQEKPDFIPIEIHDAFKNLLNKESHLDDVGVERGLN